MEILNNMMAFTNSPGLLIQGVPLTTNIFLPYNPLICSAGVLLRGKIAIQSCVFTLCWDYSGIRPDQKLNTHFKKLSSRNGEEVFLLTGPIMNKLPYDAGLKVVTHEIVSTDCHWSYWIQSCRTQLCIIRLCWELKLQLPHSSCLAHYTEIPSTGWLGNVASMAYEIITHIM